MDEAEEKRISDAYNRQLEKNAAPAPAAPPPPPPKKKWYDFSSEPAVVDPIAKQKAMADALQKEMEKESSQRLRKKVDEATK